MRARYVTYIILILVLTLWAGTNTCAQVTPAINPMMQTDTAKKPLTPTQQQLKAKVLTTADDQLLVQLQHYTDSVENAPGPKYQASLLTCGPGPEIYEYYGHSAIRIVRTDSTDFDLTFNYGVFDFTSSNFILRFALGETDYICAVQETSSFISHYSRRQIYIDEQVLNLSQLEIQRLLNALMVNCQPENRVYRYNFFYDNCATRVRDMIENCLDGKVQYPDRPTERTLRDAVHFYSHYYEWSTFGQDLVIGQQADRPATGRDLEFAPLILEQDINLTVRYSQLGQPSPLVKEQHRLLDCPPLTIQTAFPLSPKVVIIILLLATIALGVFEYLNGRIYWKVDTTLLVLQGLAGCLVAFLFFLSTHPTVGSNWLVWIFNPLPLLGIYWQIRGARKQNYKAYHLVAALIIAAFLLATLFIPQRISIEAVLLALILLIRNMTNMMVWLKLQRKKA